MLKRDSLKLGLLLGFFAPLISLVIYYLVKFYPLHSVETVVQTVLQNKQMITAISVPCLLLNIVLFTIYINSHRDHTAKGIFAITLVYAIGALLLKFIL